MTPCRLVKYYSIFEAFSPSHLKIQDVKTWRFKKPTRRHIRHNLISINTALNKLKWRHLRNTITIVSWSDPVCLLVFRCSSHLDTNNNNTVKAAPSNRMYVYRTVRATVGGIRHISTEHHIQKANVHYNRDCNVCKRDSCTNWCFQNRRYSTQNTQTKTPTTYSLQLAVCSAAVLPLHSI